MSDKSENKQPGSEKKLKQMRLPFSPLTSPKAPSSAPVASPKGSTPTPAISLSRKRKPSADVETGRSNKIGRSNSKENIATKLDAVEIIDSDDALSLPSVDKEPLLLSQEDSNPNSNTNESDGPQLHIKLPFSSKKKDAQQSQKSLDEVEDEEESSVVYIEDVVSQKKKSSKKSAKKKKRAEQANIDNVDEVKKELVMDKLDEEEPSPAAVVDVDEPTNSMSPKSFDTIPSAKESPEKADEEQEEFNDDIADVLTDFSEDLNASLNNSATAGGSKQAQKPVDITKLTPKQVARRQEFENRRLEKERKKQEERDQREQQRLREKEQREEAKRKEREEKEEARRKEKEDRDRKKQAEFEKKEQERKQKEEERKRAHDQKEEEKRQKEEERKRQAEQREEERRVKDEEKKRQAELREEEKRQKEDEKRRKDQEEEDKKKKASAALLKFLVKKDKPTSVDDEVSREGSEASEIASSSNFMPFQIRERMKLAPLVRVQLTKDQMENFDKQFSGADATKSYVKELRDGKRKPLKGVRTWQTDKEDDEIQIVGDELDAVGEFIPIDEAKIKSTLKAKLLSFHENRRPAYYGTWQKKTKLVHPRNPFAKDDKFFDYEVDSDDEWEEEEPGESIHGSDSEKEKEKEDEDDYEIDNDFMVPHGHLSDEEMKQMDDDDEDNSPEIQKAKMKILQAEFAEEMKKKTEKIKPRLIGCIWMNGDEDENGLSMVNDEKTYHCSDVIWRILKAREAWCVEASIDFVVDKVDLEAIVSDESNDKTSKVTKTPQAKQTAKAKFDETILKQLIRLLHGNVNSKKFIIKEFQAYRLKNFHKDPDFLEFSVKAVDEKIVEISEWKSCPDEGPMFGKKCWYVKQDIREQNFGDEELPLPNEWSYFLEKEKKTKSKSEKTTKDEKAAGTSSANTTPQSAVKKRAPLLKSVPFDKSAMDESKQEDKPTQFLDKSTRSSPLKRKSPSKDEPSKSQPAKKRVQLLMSVPLGVRVDEKQKNQIMDKFLSKSTTSSNVAAATSSAQVETESKKADNDEIIILDDEN